MRVYDLVCTCTRILTTLFFFVAFFLTYLLILDHLKTELRQNIWQDISNPQSQTNLGWLVVSVSVAFCVFWGFCFCRMFISPSLDVGLIMYPITAWIIIGSNAYTWSNVPLHALPVNFSGCGPTSLSCIPVSIAMCSGLLILMYVYLYAYFDYCYGSSGVASLHASLIRARNAFFGFNAQTVMVCTGVTFDALSAIYKRDILDECSVCMRRLKPKTPISILPCSHYFCTQCIEKLVAPTCPLCRQNFC